MAATAAAGCDAQPSWERETMGRRYFDSTGVYVHAGVSARTDVNVRPLEPASLGADARGRAADLLRSRCGSCHAPPDPGMRSAEHWSFLVPRMRRKTETAGLLPMTPAEADTILALLRAHAGS